MATMTGLDKALEADLLTVDILTAARWRIAKPERWCKDAYGRDDYGVAISYDDTVDLMQAASVCMITALEHSAADFILTPSYERAMLVVRKVIVDCKHNDDIVRFNDQQDTKHADVIEVFDLAIDIAQATVGVAGQDRLQRLIA